MKKLEKKQIIGLAALAVGALVVRKIASDVKKIRERTAEKEALLAEEAEEILAIDPEMIEETEGIELDIEATEEQETVAEEATDAPAEATETETV